MNEIIIEKKDTRPSVKDIVVPFNYVLIKMEPPYETLQYKGRETKISVSPITYDEHQKQIRVDERLVSPFGVVMKKPLKLVYNGHVMKTLVEKYDPIRQTGQLDQYGERQKVIVDYSALRQINDLKSASVSYDTDLEINTGDRVHVSYLHYLNAEKQALFIQTQEGEMVLVKYDLLRMVVDENDQPKRMLNGYLLLQPEESDVEIIEDDKREFTELQSGIVLLNPKKEKKTRKRGIGRILAGGTPLRGYLEEPNKVDNPRTYKSGDRVLYDPRYALKLENDLHQVISEKDLYLIRRDAIITDEYELPTDFDKIEI